MFLFTSFNTILELMINKCFGKLFNLTLFPSFAMIEEILKQLKSKGKKLQNQTEFITELSKKANYVGKTVNNSRFPDSECFYYYVPGKKQGIVLQIDSKGLIVISHGDMNKKEFLNYYKPTKP